MTTTLEQAQQESREREENRRLEKVWTLPLEHPRLQSLTEGAHKCVDCQSLELDDNKNRCEFCQESQDWEEQEERIRQYWENYNEGEIEVDTRNSDYMAACRVK